MKLHIWYGNRQRVGHLGDAQDDFNLLGEVDAPAELERLTCTVNDRLPAWPIAVGLGEDGFGDGRRLARNGHFNADIPMCCLEAGENRLVVQARWRDGSSERSEVHVSREDGECPLPLSLDWEQVSSPQDVGQCVDGAWHVGTSGLRTTHTGYDRLFLIGNRTWHDYEVTVPVTIHHVEPVTAPMSGGSGVGLLFRFCGHVIGGPRRFPPGQPKWGYQPFGSITWLRWMDRLSGPPHKQFYRGDRDGMTGHGPFEVREGATYRMRGQCRTLEESEDEGITDYRFRIWDESLPEPVSWDVAETQSSATALRAGGLALLAHHVDASFGNVTVTELE